MLFLGGNEHSVKVSSNSEMVSAGVPFENFGDYRELISKCIVGTRQGCVTSPIQFLLFINDLINCLRN